MNNNERKNLLDAAISVRADALANLREARTHVSMSDFDSIDYLQKMQKEYNHACNVVRYRRSAQFWGEKIEKKRDKQED